MIIEGYPVGWALDARHSAPFTVYLIDLPGVAMQGRTFREAVGKLQEAAPQVLGIYRREGKLLPTPSPEPGLGIRSIQWLRQLPRREGSAEPAPQELAADAQLAMA